MNQTNLYFSPQPTRSARARWAFLEAGLSFEGHPIDIFKGEHKSPDFAAINPLTLVPAARFEDQVVIESAALAWIAAHTGKTSLVPETGSSAWRRAIQWTVFAPAEIDPLMVVLNDQRLFLPKEKRSEEAKSAAIERFEKRASLVASSLGQDDYLLGSDFSVADICVGHSLAWAKMHGLLPSDHALSTYFGRLEKRPMFAEVYGGEIQVMPERP